MTFNTSAEQSEDLRRRLELVYARAFDEAETREIAERLYLLYEELKGL